MAHYDKRKMASSSRVRSRMNGANKFNSMSVSMKSQMMRIRNMTRMMTKSANGMRNMTPVIKLQMN